MRLINGDLWLVTLIIVLADLWRLPVVNCVTTDNAQHLKDLWDLESKEQVPESQIRKWWYNTQAKDRDYPRTYPFCFRHQSILHPAITDKMKHVMSTKEGVRVYDPQVDGWSGSLKQYFKSVEVKRIQIQKKNPVTSIFKGEEGKKPYTLEQWVDFLVTFQVPVDYFYAQAYGGPLGTPTGEFTDEFHCTDGEKDDDDYENKIHLVPCQFAPRNAITWPNVFIMNMVPYPKEKVQFRFRWTETHCHETGYFQFIFSIIMGQKIKTALSPVFSYQTLDDHTAVPSPYHFWYDKITCGIPSHPYNSNIKVYDDGLRIIPNKEYDDCLLYGGEGTSDIDLDTCPPGLFECSDYWNGEAGWYLWIHGEWWNKTVKGPRDECCELDHSTSGTTTPTSLIEETIPTTTTTTESPLHKHRKEQEAFLNYKTKKYELKHKITHGDFCVLVWLVLVPTADNIARFFKDFSDFKDLGLGFWILVHVGLHSVGLMTVWWSFGLVIGGGEDKLGDVTISHFLTGIIATIFQHAQFITGLMRSGTERKIFDYVLIHSLCGYFSHLVGYAAVFFSPAGTVRKWISLGLFSTWLLCTIAFFFVEIRQDKKIGVVFHRAQCPVLQRIMLDNGPPPLGKVKIAILTFSVVVQGSLFIYMYVVHSAEETALKNLYLIDSFADP